MTKFLKYWRRNRKKTPRKKTTLPWACFCLNLFRIFVASNPALSHSCLGITSKALAMAAIRYLLNSSSMAPPPATTASFLIARLTIMMASWRDRSVSSMNCSAPPRNIIVQVWAWGQPVNKLYLQRRKMWHHYKNQKVTRINRSDCWDECQS